MCTSNPSFWWNQVTVYYNEIDTQAAQWLRNLGKNQIHVDERSIAEVPATDVMEFSRAHFFAGIGGWELALRLA